MNWPGETLIIKLWESLADKGVGGLLKPWQIRREGAAQTDVKRHEVLALAEAEREAEEIRSGKLMLADARYAISLTSNSTTSSDLIASESPAIQIATKAVIEDSLRKEINVAKAVTYAEDELKDDQSAVTEDEIEADWLYRWRDYAGEVSSDELQAIWGKILAGEVKSPGAYSYRLLEFVRNLSRSEALLIEKVASFVITDFILREPQSALTDEDISFNTLLKLQELGVVSGVEAIGLNKEYSSTDPKSFIRIFCCHGRGVLVKHSDLEKKLKVGVYVITTLGQQVFKLGRFKANENYLKAAALQIGKQGFGVGLCDYVPTGNNQIRFFNNQEITKEAQPDP